MVDGLCLLRMQRPATGRPQLQIRRETNGTRMFRCTIAQNSELFNENVIKANLVAHSFSVSVRHEAQTLNWDLACLFQVKIVGANIFPHVASSFK